MLKLTIEVEVKTENVLCFVLDIVQGQVKQGFTSGFGSNENGSYSYTITEEEERKEHD